MAEFLSQDEIDALLDIAEQGDDIDGTNPLDKFTAKEKNYSIYDFKKPNRVTLDQLKALTTMHDKMLREFLFKDGDVVGNEQAMTGKEESDESSSSVTLNIGKNKK